MQGILRFSICKKNCLQTKTSKYQDEFSSNISPWIRSIYIHEVSQDAFLKYNYIIPETLRLHNWENLARQA